MAPIIALPFLILGVLGQKRVALVAGIGISAWMWWGTPFVQAVMLMAYGIGHYFKTPKTYET